MEMLREILLESNEFKALKKHKQPLSPEEREECMDKKAVWHPSHLPSPTPAVWKSVNPKTKKTTYITNTHRAYNTASTIGGAIGRFHKFIKSTA